MKIARKMFQGTKRGYALLITVVFIGIALMMLAGIMNWTKGASLQAERNNLYRASTGAADAATELAMAYMWRDFYNQTFGSASNYTDHLPDEDNWPVQFNFSNGARLQNHTGVVTQPSNWTTNWQTLGSSSAPYTGLSAFVAQCTVTSTATTSNQPYAVAATVQQKFQLAAIPIFQFAVFYNLNMEIDPGATMTITGPVFSNDGIWARGFGSYNSSFSSVGAVNTSSSDPFVSGKTDSTGSTFNGGVTSNANTLTLPLGTSNPNSVQALLGLPPSGTAPYSVTGQNYFENEANVVVSNSPSGKLSAFFQDPSSTTPLQSIPYDVGTNSYSFLTNVTFYDFREKKTVDAVQLNVGALNTWLGNSSGGLGFNNKMNLDNQHHINSVYIYNNNPVTGSTLPAVRVSNGSVLPSDGLTVVTPDPLYVLGNYNASGQSLNNGTNVANTAPASLIGDAITVLSGNWSDSYNSSTPLASRKPTTTTVNAAAFEGIVQSANGNYSGGVENFLRLLENWNTTVPLTYNGSIVVMFPSKYATNNWSYGSYYTAAVRNWAFDLNFMTQKGIPPLTPEVQAIVRQSWAAF